MSINPRIVILILGYNSRKDLKDLLESSYRQTYDNFELIFIDNNSSDDSLSYIKKCYPNLRLIENKKNLGYAGAYNIALKNIFQENFDGAVLLNTDVILDKNWLLNLVESAYSDKKVAIAQPKIFLWDGKHNDFINTSGNEINYLGFGFCGNYKKKDRESLSRDKEITYASGCCMLIKKDYYSEIGEFDEKFFMYYEDQDLGWRARMKGYKIVLSAKSVMFHKYKFQNGAINKKKLFYLERNRFYFIFKNYSLAAIILITPALLFMEIGVVLDSIARGYFLEKIKGYWEFAKNIKPLYNDREEVQKERVVNDSELFHFLNPIIDFEEIDSYPLEIANLFLKFYHKIISNYFNINFERR